MNVTAVWYQVWLVGWLSEEYFSGQRVCVYVYNTIRKEFIYLRAMTLALVGFFVFYTYIFFLFRSISFYYIRVFLWPFTSPDTRAERFSDRRHACNPHWDLNAILEFLRVTLERHECGPGKIERLEQTTNHQLWILCCMESDFVATWHNTWTPH
jgi:hypothetical protein